MNDLHCLILGAPQPSVMEPTEKHDATLTRRLRVAAARQAGSVKIDLHALQQRQFRLQMVESEIGIGTALFEFLRIAPHLDVVILHRAVLDAQRDFAVEQTGSY